MSTAKPRPGTVTPVDLYPPPWSSISSIIDGDTYPTWGPDTMIGCPEAECSAPTIKKLLMRGGDSRDGWAGAPSRIGAAAGSGHGGAVSPPLVVPSSKTG